TAPFPGATWGSDIAVDLLGQAYVTGFTNAIDFPTTSGAFQTAATFSGVDLAFVTKLNAAGDGLVYSTYLGGRQGVSHASGIAVDPAGSASVIGTTTAADYPTLNAFQTAHAGGGVLDDFVTRLNADGSGLLYSTFLGGGGQDLGTDIAADNSGGAYVTGV